MPTPHAETRQVELEPLGERLSSLRLCEATAVTAVRRSLEQHGQLTALTLFLTGDGLEIIDGFKRVRAARSLGWPTLAARIDDVGPIDAKLRLRELHDRRGLTELEEAWLVRSLHREDRISLPDLARRMSRHRSWIWRRLMLVESLDPVVQADVRLGLLAPRAAVAVSRLPRGNQQAASAVVIRFWLTVGHIELLVEESRRSRHQRAGGALGCRPKYLATGGRCQSHPAVPVALDAWASQSRCTSEHCVQKHWASRSSWP